MAYLKQDEEEQQGSGLNQALIQQPAAQQTQQQTQQEQTPTVSGPSSGSAINQPVKPLPTPQKAGTGTFANLRSYLEANKGNKIASAASQRLTGLTTGAQKGIQQAGTAFGKQLEAGSLQNRQQALSDIQSIVGTARSAVAPQPQPQAQTQQQIETQPQASVEQPTAPVTQPTPQYFTPEQQQRFADIINTAYTGPGSLQQAGLYQTAEQKTRAAQEALQKIKTAGGREGFLRDIFGKGREYTEGQARLDALLMNVSPEAVGRLQQQVAQTGDITSQLQKAENVSKAMALGRTTELENIQKQARDEYERQRLEELTGTETRIGQARTQGQELADYFKSVFASSQNKPVDISATEAAILGIKAGEGLYNLTPDQIVQVNQLRDEQLISKNERARLEALVNLANLDKQRQLKTEYFQKYADAEKAGTQSVFDVLNTQAIRDALNAEEERFIEDANRTITGYGSGSAKYSKGLFKGRGTVSASAEFSKNLKDLLKKSGYNVTPEKEALLSSPDVVKAIARSAQTSGASTEGEILNNALSILNSASRAGAEKVTGAVGEGAQSISPESGITPTDLGTMAGAFSAGSSLDAAAATAGAFGGAPATSMGPYALLAAIATDADMRESLGSTVKKIGGNELGDITSNAMEAFDAAGGLADMLGEIGSLGTVSGLGSSIFGGGKSGARKKAQSEAERNAAADLKNKILKSLSGAGFERRTSLLDRPEIEKALGGLQQQETGLKKEIENLQADRNRLQNYYKSQDFGNLLGREVRDEFLGPRILPFSKEEQLANVQNEINTAKENINRLETSKKRGRYTQAINDYKSRLNALQDMSRIISSDSEQQIASKQEAIKALSPKIGEQQGYLSRVGDVEKRNAGLQALLKKLDLTNV